MSRPSTARATAGGRRARRPRASTSPTHLRRWLRRGRSKLPTNCVEYAVRRVAQAHIVAVLEAPLCRASTTTCRRAGIHFEQALAGEDEGATGALACGGGGGATCEARRGGGDGGGQCGWGGGGRAPPRRGLPLRPRAQRRRRGRARRAGRAAAPDRQQRRRRSAPEARPRSSRAYGRRALCRMRGGPRAAETWTKPSASTTPSAPIRLPPGAGRWRW